MKHGRVRVRVCPAPSSQRQIETPGEDIAATRQLQLRGSCRGALMSACCDTLRMSLRKLRTIVRYQGLCYVPASEHCTKSHHGGLGR